MARFVQHVRLILFQAGTGLRDIETKKFHGEAPWLEEVNQKGSDGFESTHGLGHALPKVGRRIQIALDGRVIRPLVTVGLSHRAQPATHAIEVMHTAIAAVVAGFQVEPDPQHAVLGRKQRH